MPEPASIIPKQSSRRALYDAATTNIFDESTFKSFAEDQEATTLFLYGTLQCPDILAHALQRPRASASGFAAMMTPATLTARGCDRGEEWRALAFKYVDLPGLVRYCKSDIADDGSDIAEFSKLSVHDNVATEAESSGPVKGLLLLGVRDRDIDLLDELEECQVRYRRDKVVVKVEVLRGHEKVKYKVRTHTYVCKANYEPLLTQHTWEIEEFLALSEEGSES